MISVLEAYTRLYLQLVLLVHYYDIIVLLLLDDTNRKAYIKEYSGCVSILILIIVIILSPNIAILIAESNLVFYLNWTT